MKAKSFVFLKEIDAIDNIFAVLFSGTQLLPLYDSRENEVHFQLIPNLVSTNATPKGEDPKNLGAENSDDFLFTNVLKPHIYRTIFARTVATGYSQRMNYIWDEGIS